MTTLVQIITAAGPSIGVGVIFFIVLRAVLRADRSEREALAAMENREDEAKNSSSDTSGQSTDSPAQGEQQDSARRTE